MGDRHIDPRKICFMQLDPDEPDDKIRRLCEAFGPLLNFNRPPSRKELAFALFNSEANAQKAKDVLGKKGFNVGFAHAKKPENERNGEKPVNFRVEKTVENGERVQNRLNSFPKQIETPEMTQASIRAASSTNSLHKLHGVCAYCSRDAALSCDRCGDYYCSEECQELDWLVHKKICFPMPKLIQPKRRFAGLPERANSIESLHSQVVPNHNRVVQPIDASDGSFAVSRPRSVSPRVKSPQTVKEASIKSIPKSKPNEIVKQIGQVEKDDDDAASVKTDKSVEIIRKNMASKPIDSIKIGTIANGDKVEFLNVKNHYSDFLRSLKSNEEFSAMLTHVAKESKNAKPLTCRPLRDTLVLAPFEGDYYRAMVLKEDKSCDMFLVAFIDFGNTADVPFDKLREFHPDLLQYSRQAILVVLKGVDQDVEEGDAKKMLDFMKTLEYSHAKVQSGDENIVKGSNVELIDVKADKTINEMVSALAKKRFWETDIKRKEVTTEDVMVVVLESRKYQENIATFVLQSDFKEFTKQHQLVQHIGDAVKNAPAYSPKQWEMCLVRIMEDNAPTWYRAQFQQPLVDCRAQVGLLDFGVEENVQENDKRRPM